MGKAKSVIFKDMEHCIVCGSPYVQHHHIFYGIANRKISDRLGYLAPLCQVHHTGNEGVHFNRDFDLSLKRAAQRHFEENYGDKELFIKTFGRSYL